MVNIYPANICNIKIPPAKRCSNAWLGGWWFCSDVCTLNLPSANTPLDIECPLTRAVVYTLYTPSACHRPELATSDPCSARWN